jgi:hypothetical protein
MIRTSEPKKNRRGEQTERKLTTSKSSSLLAGDRQEWRQRLDSLGEEKGRVERGSDSINKPTNTGRVLRWPGDVGLRYELAAVSSKV